jgi:glycosyltransferase involved in cell wall biosynthesis
MESPGISIIIPHFERVELLRETLRSIENQSSSQWEVIIVDDGSRPETYNSVTALGNNRVHALQRNGGEKGPSCCRNLGIFASKGEYILFLDSDDLLAPHCIEQRLRHAAISPNADFWVFPVEIFRQIPGDTREPWNDMRKGKFIDPLRRFLVSDPPWCVSSTLWKRETLRKLGGFNERVMYGDDADLHTRALLANFLFIDYPETEADVYIRRSETARITNSCGPKLLESRRVRLQEGTKALAQSGANSELKELWEGQYFVEGEFLMFTQERSKQDLKILLGIWSANYPESRKRLWISSLYFCWGNFFRKRCYLLVRLARRIVMTLWPPSWFPDQIKSVTQ